MKYNQFEEGDIVKCVKNSRYNHFPEIEKEYFVVRSDYEGIYAICRNCIDRISKQFKSFKITLAVGEKDSGFYDVFYAKDFELVKKGEDNG